MQRSHDDLGDPSSQAVGSEERQMDEKYRKLVMQRQIMNYQRQRVSSLQDLTLDVVINIVKQCAHDKQEPRPLDALPGPLLELAYEKLIKDNIVHHFDIVKQLITPRSRSVKFFLRASAGYEPSWRPWTQDKVTTLLALLDKCKNQLTTLKVYVQVKRVDPSLPQLHKFLGQVKIVDPSLPHSQLHELLRHQANLRELHLSCDINDQTLALISSTCHNLRVLDVSNNKAVTDVGLEHLSKGPDGKPSNITQVNVHGTQVTARGIAKLMVKLQAQLEYVEADGFMIEAALVQLCKVNPTIRLQKFKKFCFLSNIICYLPTMVNLMPNVSTLELFSCRDVTPLLTLTKVTSLRLTLNQRGQNLILSKLILHWSSTLTHVDLSNDSDTEEEIDFSVFSQCPNLEEILLFFLNLQVERNHELLPSSFSKLRVLHFLFGARYGTMPGLIVAKMLTSKCLETFRANFVIDDRVIRSVISEAHTNPDIFSNLKLLDLRVTSGVTFDTWIQLLCVVPDDAGIRMGDSNGIISDEWSGKLQSFVHRNNIKTCIDIL